MVLVLVVVRFVMLDEAHKAGAQRGEVALVYADLPEETLN